LRRAHVGPQHAAALDQRVGLELHAPAQTRVVRLGGDLDALAGHVVFPAVVGAAQAAFLVAAEPERHAAVRAELVHQAEAVAAVAERDQPFREQLDAHRSTVRLGQLGRKQCRQPVAPEQRAHRRAGTGLSKQPVLLWSHDRVSGTSGSLLPALLSERPPAPSRKTPVARNTGTAPSAAPKLPNTSGTAICVTLLAMMRMPSASPERPAGAWL